MVHRTRGIRRVLFAVAVITGGANYVPLRAQTAVSSPGKIRGNSRAQRSGEDARRSDAAGRYLPAEGGRKISGAAGAHALRQETAGASLG